MTNDNGERPASWLSVQAAASELEVTTRTIYRFINDGKLAAYRIGRVYRIRRDDLEAFLMRCAIQPGDLDHLVDDGRSRSSAGKKSQGRDGVGDNDHSLEHDPVSADSQIKADGQARADGQISA